MTGKWKSSSIDETDAWLVVYAFVRYTFSSNWNRFKRFHSLCLCNEEWKIKSFYINDLIFHSSLHKQRLRNLLKRFQFDEKQHLIYIYLESWKRREHRKRVFSIDLQSTIKYKHPMRWRTQLKIIEAHMMNLRSENDCQQKDR